VGAPAFGQLGRRPAHPEGHELGRDAADFRRLDGASLDYEPMFARRALDGRHCPAAVFAHEMEHLGAVELTTLAVGVAMAAPANTET
jgi:hypothetical protein